MSTSGFTLIEAMLSVAMIAIITGIAAPVYLSFQTRNDLDVAVTIVVQAERRAQALARGSEGESNWGVAVAQGSVTLFKGESYDTREEIFDETFDLPASIVPSGGTEIVFAKYSGLPTSLGSFILTSRNGDVRSVETNEKGTIIF